jgi:hypothetical protein
MIKFVATTIAGIWRKGCIRLLQKKLQHISNTLLRLKALMESIISVYCTKWSASTSGWRYDDALSCAKKTLIDCTVTYLPVMRFTNKRWDMRTGVLHVWNSCSCNQDQRERWNTDKFRSRWRVLHLAEMRKTCKRDRWETPNAPDLQTTNYASLRDDPSWKDVKDLKSALLVQQVQFKRFAHCYIM